MAKRTIETDQAQAHQVHQQATQQASQQAAQQAPQSPQAEAKTQLAVTDNALIQVGFDTVPGYNALQRLGIMFSKSSLVPDQYKGENGIPNAIIAVEMAMRMGASPLMVMQNMYIVHNRPAWSAQFLISTFNSCGRFEAIRYRFTGQKGTDSWGCVAYTRERATGETIEGPEVTIAMAKKEGWYSKNGSKWQSIPQLMLCYRSATFMIRTTAPELAMGLRTADEVEDIGEERVARVVTPKFKEDVERAKNETSVDADFEDRYVPDPAESLMDDAAEVDEDTGEMIFK